jgi:hypothetical protein
MTRIRGRARGRILAAAQAGWLVLGGVDIAQGHSGPPYPILTDRVVGGYEVSVWSDPDATDDRTPDGKFWVIVHSTAGTEPDGRTRVTVAARPLDRRGAEQRAEATPQPGTPSRYFSSLILDHEGRWQVEVVLEGPLGSGATSTEVDATYDLRPSLVTLPFLVLPFVLIGFLWQKALRTGRRRPRPPGAPRGGR